MASFTANGVGSSGDRRAKRHDILRATRWFYAASRETSQLCFFGPLYCIESCFPAALSTPVNSMTLGTHVLFASGIANRICSKSTGLEFFSHLNYST